MFYKKNFSSCFLVSTQDRGRSNTLPSSSLSSIWSQQQSPPINNASSPNSRTYANVLRQHDDPLMKIRQLGTKGSQDLSESSSETTSDGVNQPFSPFGAKWWAYKWWITPFQYFEMKIWRVHQDEKTSQLYTYKNLLTKKF